MSANTTDLSDLEEIDRFEQAVQAFFNGQIDADRFTAIRLQQGVYGQRQEGVNMLRVKVPGGRLSLDQLDALADVTEKYAQRDVAHITTRQSVQIHFIPLAKVPAAIRRLAQVGLTSREACGNAVRNMSACALSGVCPREHVDVNAHVDGAVQHFLRNPLNQQLPRKFKFSFSACEADCAQSLLQDAGIVATVKNGQSGFVVKAGGGLGHKPREAIVVEEFIPEHELLFSMEALVTLHNKYSDRTKRAKSRIKFLIERFGVEGFLEKYREEFARTKQALAGQSYPHGTWRTQSGRESPGPGAPRKLFAQRQQGLFVLPVAVPLGDLSVAQMRGITQLLRAHGLSEIHTAQDQNFAILNVAQEQVAGLRAGLAALNLREPAAGDNVTACPGSSTCRLGITSSMVVAPKLSGGVKDLRIRVSGCHNGCAQPETGDIGIYGEGKRLHGKLVPHYQMYFGGDGRSNGGLALKGPSVPAARVEAAIQRVQDSYAQDRREGEDFFQWTRRHGAAYFKELLQDITHVTPEQLVSVMNDHGEARDFKVLQLGGGECAGAAQEFVASHFAEAAYERDCRNSFAAQHKYPEALECAEAIGRLVGESLLFASGRTAAAGLAEIAAVLKDSLKQDAALGAQLADFAATIAQLKDTFDEQGYAKLAAEQDAWIAQAARACQTLDRQLNLTVSITAPLEAAKTSRTVDLSTYGCPLHYLKARNELDSVPVGDVVDFLLESGKSTRQVASSLESDGHRVLYKEERGATTRITVKKAGRAAA